MTTIFSEIYLSNYKMFNLITKNKLKKKTKRKAKTKHKIYFSNPIMWGLWLMEIKISRQRNIKEFYI